MENTINMQEIFLLNLLAIILIFQTFVSNRITLRKRNAENNMIIGIMICIFSCCAIDIAVFYVDGRPGRVSHLINY